VGALGNELNLILIIIIILHVLSVIELFQEEAKGKVSNPATSSIW
jgi:hypothetical protein